MISEKFREKLIQWLWRSQDDGTFTDEEIDSAEFEEFEEQLKTWACEFVGSHQPERDHCGIPEHDHCFWCGKSMPNSWVRPIQGAAS